MVFLLLYWKKERIAIDKKIVFYNKNVNIYKENTEKMIYDKSRKKKKNLRRKRNGDYI